MLRLRAIIAPLMAMPSEAPHARASGSIEGARSTVALDITTLYRRYGDLVQGRCRTLLRNDADAQDATQEVFLKAHRYASEFRGDASPSTWLFRITTTTCLNMMRSRKRHPEDPVEVLPEMLCQDSVLDQLMVRQLLQLALKEEDERTQACLIYHYVDGMTHEEAGDMLGISGAAVRKRISAFRSGLAGQIPPWLQEAP